MKRPPYTANESVFGRGMVQFIIGIGIIMTALAIGAAWGLWHEGDPRWQTVLFTTLVLSQLAVAVATRSEENPIWRLNPFTNRSMVLAVVLTIALQLAVIYLPLANTIFDTQPLEPVELALSFGLALLTLIIVEIWKAVARRWHRARQVTG
jgi:Ca2+-transporting ATPase